MNKKRLGDIVYRVKNSVDRNNTDLVYYVGGEHYDSGSLSITRKGIISKSTIGPAFSTKFESNDVLLMSRNPHLRKAGIVDFEGICSDVSYIIRTRDESVLLQRFIPILFQSDIFWNFAERNKKGSTNFFLNWSDFERFEFHLPSIDEQRILSEALWAIDKTIESYREILWRSDEIIKSKFVEMFGNLGFNEKGFKTKKLKECCILNPRKPKDIDEDLKISFVPMSLVSETGEIDTTNVREYKEVKKGYTYFEEDDVLFAKITPCMENGKGAIATGLSNGIGIGSTEFHVLRSIENISNPTWLYMLTKMDAFRVDAEKNMTGTGGQLRVPISYLENYEIGLPSIELQIQYEKFVNDVTKSKIPLNENVKHLSQLYQKIVNSHLLIREE